MACRRYIFHSALAVLAGCTLALASGSTKKPAKPARRPLPPLSAQQIFKRASPSIMVVEALDAKGKVIDFGSGVVIAPGRVITNRHVIKDGVSFRVLHNTKKRPAKLIKVDPDHDLAELSVTGLDAPAVAVLNSSKLAVGETVYAIGAPEGLELTISEGLISGLRDFDKSLVIQTSAAISPGSSGGGLFDAQGRLVGITTFYLKEGQSLNFALPAEWTLALNRQPANATAMAQLGSPVFEALVWFEEGFGALKAGKSQSAVLAFKHALKLKPDLEIAWGTMGLAYVRLGQYGKAVSAEQEAVRIKPDDDLPWVMLGIAYERLGQYGKAVSANEEVVGLKPDDALTWYSLGLDFKFEGRQSEVIKVYEKLKTLDPKLAEKFFQEAVLP